MTSHSVFKPYFDLLDETLSKHGLKDKPSQIYNCDESGILLEHKLPKIVAPRGMKKVRQCMCGTNKNSCMCQCSWPNHSSDGGVFAGKNHNNTLSKGEFPETLYGMSESGWMDQELFLK